MNHPVLHLSLPVQSLAEARAFYLDVLGCRPGRQNPEWCDVWFFGLQLTLQERPEEVRQFDEQGVRHFGVVLPSEPDFDELVARITRSGASWITEPTLSDDPNLSGKLGGKLADPSGNVIEIKWYSDASQFLSE